MPINDVTSESRLNARKINCHKSIMNDVMNESTINGSTMTV